MPRIQPVNPETAGEKTRALLDAAKKKLGGIPNLLKTFAHSPAVLESYLAFKAALDQGVLTARVREQIALAVAQDGGCDYCLAAHTMIGKGAGLSPAEILDARRGTATDAKARAAVTFAKRVVSERGHVADTDLAAARAGGLNDAEISEVIAVVALNLFTNYFNHVAGTDVDFPRAESLAS